jgi:hypothetical protein
MAKNAPPEVVYTRSPRRGVAGVRATPHVAGQSRAGTSHVLLPAGWDDGTGGPARIAVGCSERRARILAGAPPPATAARYLAPAGYDVTIQHKE